jgi:ubiquinone/menaquinone biosynthesis C-methylase UbiE
VEANAEATGLPSASFDLAISEYGASIWCDPYKWIPEAARLLRADGELVFLSSRPSPYFVSNRRAVSSWAGVISTPTTRRAPRRFSQAAT